MSSKHLVDPQLLRLLEQFPPTSLSDENLHARRDELKALLVPPPATRGVAIAETFIPGPAGAPRVRVLTYAPVAAGAVRPGIVHIHGGGYVVGVPEMQLATNVARSEAADCVIVSPDYRLAPESPFPQPLEDCYATLKWLHANAAELGVDRARIAVAGESAGGGLAAALALLARDRGEIPLCFQLLIFPMIDDRTAIAEPHPYTGEFIWTPAKNAYAWKAYLGDGPGRADVSPYAAPARSLDLTRLPPAYIEVGALDLFFEEDLEYARRLTHAGVPTELHVYPGAFHGFQAAIASDLAATSRANTLSALKRAFR